MTWDLRPISSSLSIRQRRLIPHSKCTCRLTLMAHLAADIQQSLITVTRWNRWSWYPARLLRWRPRFLNALLNGTYILWDVFKVQANSKKEIQVRKKTADMDWSSRKWICSHLQCTINHYEVTCLLRSVYFEAVARKNKSYSLYQVVELVKVTLWKTI